MTTSNSMQILVGSKNPVKTLAVKEAFENLFPQHSILVEGQNVASEVAEQPMSEKETYLGAQNRAQNLLKLGEKADYYIGIEGGLSFTELGAEAFAWIYILDKDLNRGYAKTSTFFLPKEVVHLIKNGKELGEANDIVFQDHNSKQKGGAVGLLTKELITRKAYYKEATILAMIPFLNKELYL